MYAVSAVSGIALQKIHNAERRAAGGVSRRRRFDNDFGSHVFAGAESSPWGLFGISGADIGTANTRTLAQASSQSTNKGRTFDAVPQTDTR